MSRTSVASRRFYRAFYEWTLLTAPVGVSISGARGHGYHTTGRHQDGEPSFTIRRTTGGDSAFARQSDSWPRRKGSIIEQWKTAPVQTAMEKPFSTLKAYEAIVRYRSEYGLMIEYAALSTVLERMQKRLGKQLEELSKKHGSRIEVQTLSAPANLADPDGPRIVSVLVSGTFAETVAVYNTLQGWRGPPKTSEAIADKQGANLPVFSHLARPSTSLTPGEYLARERRDDNMTMEVSVPEGDFMKYVATSSINSIAQKWNVDVTVGEPEQRPLNTTSSETSMARSFVISGPVDQVNRAKNHVLNSIVSKKGQDETVPRISDSKQVTSSAAQRSKAASTSRDVDHKYPPSSDAPKSRSSSFPIGPSIEGYEICHAKFIGPSATKLQSLFTSDKGSKLANLTRRLRPGLMRIAAAGDHDGIVTAGLPAKLALFQRDLRHEVDELCKGHGLTAHSVEFWSSSMAEHIEQQEGSVESECYILGPHSNELWDIILGDCDVGWRDIGDRLVRIAEDRKIVGSSDDVQRVHGQLSNSVSGLCRAKGFPAHRVVSRGFAASEQVAQLVEDVRGALRTMTHPVVVITSRQTKEEISIGQTDEDGTMLSDRQLMARGVTVSSFNTVSLTPYPIVSLNLKLSSRTWDAMKNTQSFNVHVLAGTPKGAAIAHTFAQAYIQPFQAFQELERIGAVVRGNRWTPPILRLWGGVVARMAVDLVLDKCIEVEDHVIVVGKVRRIDKEHSDELALSYTNRAYRGLNGIIEPDMSPGSAGEHEPKQQKDNDDALAPTPPSRPEQEEELDPLRLGEEYDPQPDTDDASPSKARRQPTEQDIVHADEPLDDPVYKTLAAIRDDIRRGEEEASLDLLQRFNNDQEDVAAPEQSPADKLAREAKRRAAQQEEEEYDFGFDEPEHGNKSFMTEETTRDAPPPESQPPSRPAHAWGLPYTTSQRSYSTFARPSSILGAPTGYSRRFATTSVAQRESSADLTNILDPSAAQTTVSDYLSLPEEAHDKEGRYRPHVKQRPVKVAIKDRRDIAQLKDLLSKGYTLSRNGDEVPLTSEERSNIEHKIVVLERKVSVILAMNAMWHLKAMLDKARYHKMFWDQAPFLEGLIEQGMATLMADARDLRKMVDEGKIERERFEYLSKKLTGRYEGMERETSRLKQITEEESDGGVREMDDDEDW